MGVTKSLADYNFTGHLNALLQPIQKNDRLNDWGRRSVHLSEYPKLLEGFSLNNKRTFDSVIRTPVACSVQRDSGSATLTIPALAPGINFFPLPYHPLYSLVVEIGTVPDLSYDEELKSYREPNGYKFSSRDTQTDWLHISRIAEPVTLALNLPNVPRVDGYSIIVSIGICYGTIGDNQQIQRVAGAGAAKILNVS